MPTSPPGTVLPRTAPDSNDPAQAPGESAVSFAQGIRERAARRHTHPALPTAKGVTQTANAGSSSRDSQRREPATSLQEPGPGRPFPLCGHPRERHDLRWHRAASRFLQGRHRNRSVDQGLGRGLARHRGWRDPQAPGAGKDGLWGNRKTADSLQFQSDFRGRTVADPQLIVIV